MKSICSFIICCILLFLLYSIVSAEAYDSYILKYKNNDDIQIITEKEKEYILDNIGVSTYSNMSGEIEYIEPNYDVFLYGDTEFNWNLDMINASYAWEYGCYGNGINIAVLDSGVSSFGSFVNSLTIGYNLINYSDDVTDNIGHGTFVCGIIANDNNEYTKGISPKANIIPIKCFDKNYTTKVDKIAEALKYAINNFDCDIINMSFGINGNSAYLKSVVDLAIQKGVILIAAVGNSGTDSLRFPAAYDGVIGVGAIDKQYSWCNFSQHNKSVDVVAPGKNINSVSIDGYKEDSGTSFATPHVKAAAALALSIYGEITPNQFCELLQTTSTDLGEVGYDEYYGYGLINVEKIAEQLINQNEIFMSPINIDGRQYSITIRNNTDSVLSAVNVIYDYDNNTLCKITPLNLNSYEKINVKCYTRVTGNIKSFLWDDLNTINPLTLYRQYTK